MRAITEFGHHRNNRKTLVLLRHSAFSAPSIPLTFLPDRKSVQPNATRGGEIPIISKIARILNNRCRKW
jgi:hypothetical protein